MQQALSKKSKDTKGKKNKAEGSNYRWQNVILILIIIILTASIVFGSILLFNIGGAKPAVLKMLSNVPLLGKVIKPIAENKTPEEIQMEILQAQRKDIEIQMKQLEENAKTLEEREKEIEKKEEFLLTKEDEINHRLYQLNMSLNSIKEQVEYLEKMDSSKAVQIISNMNSKGVVVQLLRNMSKEKSSAILSLMDPLQAAQILEDIKNADKEVYLNE